MDQDQLRKWEKAYISHYLEAEVGRSYCGLIHNLNGIMQAFSMQSELILMMLNQADRLAEEAGSGPEAVPEKMQQLQQLLASRRRMVEQMREKVVQGQRIMHRTLLLKDFAPEAVSPDLATLIRTEVEFLLANMFFKHSVQKELELQEGIPLSRLQLELHQAVSALLTNALEGMEGGEGAARLLVAAKRQGERLEILVQDNGRGIPPENLPRIFEPFFTTKAGHNGLGLYLAEQSIRGAGGSLSCESRPGRTIFRLELPTGAVAP